MEKQIEEIMSTPKTTFDRKEVLDVHEKFGEYVVYIADTQGPAAAMEINFVDWFNQNY